MAPTRQVKAAAASEVARLFFDRQLSKVEIGSRLGISRFRVARLIDQALEAELVRIEFRDIPDVDRALARAIEERFGIDMCVVAGGDDADNGIGRVARLAASVIDELIGRDDVVGIAWGSTLAAVVRELPSRTEPSLAVVQLAGSSVSLDRRRDPGELARSLADRLGARHHPLHAPAFVDDPAVRTALVAEPDLAATVAAFERLTIAIVGIGAMPYPGADGGESSLLRSGVLADDQVARLRGLGAVGDLVVHTFDRNGGFVAPDLAERAIAISVAQLRMVPRVVAVAAGATKATAIHGALATELVRVLVTDAPTAAAVLEVTAAGR
jgi:DNA-binding transcriptional regulator LsrR (DeoR family)